MVSVSVLEVCLLSCRLFRVTVFKCQLIRTEKYTQSAYIWCIIYWMLLLCVC